MKDIKTRNCLDVVSNCQAAALKMNYFMVPMMPNYFVTHCSLRLRDKKIKKKYENSTSRNICAVEYFRKCVSSSFPQLFLETSSTKLSLGVLNRSPSLGTLCL